MLVPPPVVQLDGTEAVRGTDARVSDFWSWAVSNLRDNVTRSMFAEYLVALAVGARHPVRIEWDSYDVLSPDGTRIEVKSSSRIQAWKQKSLSRVAFTGLTARILGEDGSYAPTASMNADVYVFAVLEAVDHETYDALCVDNWSFWVVPATDLAQRGQKSISLTTVRSMVGKPVGFLELDARIRAVSPVSPARCQAHARPE